MRKYLTIAAFLFFSLTGNSWSQEAKITELGALGALSGTDLFEVVDVSDTTMSLDGTNKKATSLVLSSYFSTSLQDTFYTESEIDAAFQPLDSLLTDIAALVDPDADRIIFWDDTAGILTWLTAGTNLTITDTTITATDTDNQTIDVFNLNGTDLELSLEDDGQATQTVDLSSLQDGTGTDDQTIDVFSLTGTNLNLSLESDGEATKQVDLSSLQDGTGTDDQTASEVSITDSGGYYVSSDVEGALAEIAGGGAQQLSELSDVNTSTATNRNVLVADGIDWESRALTEADISDLGTYIGATDVTYENLSTNGDIGTGATQVSQGDHAHAGVYEPVDATILREADVDDTPVNDVTTAPVSSNWAYDHVAASDPHTGYALESSLGTASTRNAEDILTNGSNLPDGAAIITYGDANWADATELADDTSPVLGGDLNFAGSLVYDDTGVNDDDCTSQQGYFWWDSTDNQWEFCNASSGAPDTFGAAAATQLSNLTDVNTSTPTNRNVLVADGVDWESRALVEADISDLGTYIEATDVTFENLDTNGDVGTGSSQVAEGDHLHDSDYISIVGTPTTGNFPQLTAGGELVNSVYDETSFAASSHNNTAHSETYITTSGVTYEALDGNSDVGTGADQVAVGNHDHSGTYEPVDATILREADVDDIPVDAATVAPVSSNWAYDHENATNPHSTAYSDLGSHNNTYHSETYITSTGVTYENLSANGDIGVASTQVSQGDHNHSGTYEPADSAIAHTDEAETITENWDFSGDVVFSEKADHTSTPTAGKGYLWVKNTAPSTLIFTSDAGADTTLGSGGASQLTDLSDVTSSTPTNRNVLVANGSIWASRALVEADISDLGSYLTAEVNDLSAAVTWANVPDVNITETSVTQHQAALSITESQISDLGSYILSTDVTYENLNTNGDVGSGVGQVADGQHNHSGVYEPAGITESDISDLGNYAEQLSELSDVNTSTPTNRNVLVADGVDWESRALTEADISDLGTYLTSEVNDLSSAVTWVNVPNGNITEGSVTQHQAALSITESQISDLGTYAEQLSELSDVNTSTATNRNVLVADGVDWESRALTEADISDLGTYIGTSGVTYENLSVNGDIGTGSTQVSQGDHSHSYLSNVSDDSSPTLGGDLDVVDYEITSSTGTGNVVIQLGDALGANFFEIEDSSSATQVAINSDGDITMLEKADHTVTPTAGYGYLWVKSTTPSTLIFTDDTGADTTIGSGGGGISNVVEDTTPQLGGNLDVQDFYLNSSGVGDVDVRLGDAAGTNVFRVEDSAGIQVLSVDSYGNIGMAASAAIEVNASNMIDTNDHFVVRLGDDIGAGQFQIENDSGVDQFMMNSKGEIQIRENTTHSFTPQDGFGYLWIKDDTPSSLIYTADDGTDYDLTVDDTGTDDQTASEVNTSTVNFDGHLSGSDTTVQAALETLDDIGSAYVAKTEIDSTADSLNLVTGGEIQGKVNIVNKSSNATLTDAETHGSMVFVTATATMTLPAVSIGNTVCVYSTTAAAVYVDANASDRIRLNGVALDDGDKLTSASAAGDFICLIGDSADGWTTLGRSGTWTDGGP